MYHNLSANRFTTTTSLWTGLPPPLCEQVYHHLPVNSPPLNRFITTFLWTGLPPPPCEQIHHHLPVHRFIPTPHTAPGFKERKRWQWGSQGELTSASSAPHCRSCLKRASFWSAFWASALFVGAARRCVDIAYVWYADRCVFDRLWLDGKPSAWPLPEKIHPWRTTASSTSRVAASAHSSFVGLFLQRAVTFRYIAGQERLVVVGALRWFLSEQDQCVGGVDWFLSNHAKSWCDWLTLGQS